MTVTIIADDLAGACDAGAVFCGRGRVAAFVPPADPGPDWDVAAVDTESRGLPAAEAARRMRELAARLAPRLLGGVVFKKIDSTLRGPIGAELDALLSMTGRAGALVCPAFPGQRRAVRDGVLRVAGIPAHQSAVGSDPDYPGATSDVVEILAAQSARPLRHLPLQEIRGAGEELARALRAMDGSIAVADAETGADLAALARAALAHGAVLLAGSAGLAAALACALGYAGRPVRLPDGRAWLVVAGSRHPATRAQVAALVEEGAAILRPGAEGAADSAPLVAALRAGRPAVIESPAPPPEPDRAAVAARLAAVAARVLAEVTPSLTCATGGETALAWLRALGASHLELAGAPAAGLALGDVVVGGAPAPRRLRVLTKAGGFGAPDLFIRLMRGHSP